MSIIPDPRPTIEHPRWCDPRSCRIYRVRDGSTEVFHRLVALGGPERPAGPCVEIVSYAHHDPTGVVISLGPEPARVFLRDMDDAAMTWEQAAGVAAALALAAAVLRGAR